MPFIYLYSLKELLQIANEPAVLYPCHGECFTACKADVAGRRLALDVLMLRASVQIG